MGPRSEAIPRYILMAMGVYIVITSFFGAFPDSNVMAHYDKNNYDSGASFFIVGAQLVCAMMLMIPRIQFVAAIVTGLVMLGVFVFGTSSESVWAILSPFLVFVVCIICAVWLRHASEARFSR